MSKEPTSSSGTDWGRILSAWLPVFIVMAIIFALSAQPRLPSFFPSFSQEDKVKHLIAYWALSIAAFRGALLAPLARSGGAYVQSLGLALVYGVTDEFHQAYVPGRSPDVFDWLADAAGAVLGIVMATMARRFFAEGGR
jgi:hypothetical protein